MSRKKPKLTRGRPAASRSRVSATAASAQSPILEIGTVALPASSDPLRICEAWLIVEATSGMILDIHLAFGALGPGVVDFVRGALAKRAPGMSGPVLAPRLMRVTAAGVARALEPLATQLGAALEVVSRLPGVDAAGREMPDLGRIYDPAFLGSQYRLRELCRAADRFRELAPWEVLFDEEAIEIEVSGEPLSHPAAVVLGGLGETQGVAFYRSVDALRRFGEMLEDDGTLPSSPEVDAMSLTYDSAAELPDEVRPACLRLGYGRTDRYPCFMRVEAWKQATPLTEREAGDLLVGVEALNHFFADHRPRLAEGERALEGYYSLGDGRAARVRLSPRADYPEPPGLGRLAPESPEGRLLLGLLDHEANFLVGPVSKALFAAAVTTGAPLASDVAALDMPSWADDLPCLIVKGRKADIVRSARDLDTLERLTLVPSEPTHGDELLVGRTEDGLTGVFDEVSPQIADQLRELAAANGGRLVVVWSGGGVLRDRARVRSSQLVAARVVRFVEAFEEVLALDGSDDH